MKLWTILFQAKKWEMRLMKISAGNHLKGKVQKVRVPCVVRKGKVGVFSFTQNVSSSW